MSNNQWALAPQSMQFRTEAGSIILQTSKSIVNQLNPTVGSY